MIVSVGVDVVAVERLRRRLGEDSGFLAAFLAPAETAAVQASNDPAGLAAQVFAAKEAVVKLLRVDGTSGMLLGDVELSGAGRRPEARLGGRALAAAGRLGVDRVHVATCAGEGRAFAVAVAERAVGDKERA